MRVAVHHFLQEIDKLRAEKEALYAEVTDLQRQNEALKNGSPQGRGSASPQSPHRSPSPRGARNSMIRTVADEGSGEIFIYAAGKYLVVVSKLSGTDDQSSKDHDFLILSLEIVSDS